MTGRILEGEGLGEKIAGHALVRIVASTVTVHQHGFLRGDLHGGQADSPWGVGGGKGNEQGEEQRGSGEESFHRGGRWSVMSRSFGERNKSGFSDKT